jgi:hypothetical protein
MLKFMLNLIGYAVSRIVWCFFLFLFLHVHICGFCSSIYKIAGMSIVFKMLLTIYLVLCLL